MAQQKHDIFTHNTARQYDAHYTDEIGNYNENIADLSKPFS